MDRGEGTANEQSRQTSPRLCPLACSRARSMPTDVSPAQSTFQAFLISMRNFLFDVSIDQRSYPGMPKTMRPLLICVFKSRSLAVLPFWGF